MSPVRVVVVTFVVEQVVVHQVVVEVVVLSVLSPVVVVLLEGLVQVPVVGLMVALLLLLGCRPLGCSCGRVGL